MRLSTRMRYGARALAELAEVYPDARLSVSDIADKQKMSAKYLEWIMSMLKKAGLVKAVRGMRGGYALARPPRNITLRDVFLALEGSLAPVRCADDPDSCPISGKCTTREVWEELTDCLDKFFAKRTLLDLSVKDA